MNLLSAAFAALAVPAASCTTPCGASPAPRDATPVTHVAVAHPVADAFAGDPRLSARTSLHFKAEAVRDVLADVEEQTGIHFFADPSVADDRVTLFSHNRPLGDALQAISDLQGSEWVKSSNGRRADYTLRLRAETLERQNRFVEGRLAELGRLIASEIQVDEQIEPLSAKQREDLAARLPTMIAGDKDLTRQRTLLIEQRLVEHLRERRAWMPLIYQFLRSLPPDQVAGLVPRSSNAGRATGGGSENDPSDRSSGTRVFAWPEVPGYEPLPSATVDDLRRFFAREYSPSPNARADVVSLRLRFTAILGRQPYVRVNLHVGQRSVYGPNNFGLGDVLPASYTLLSDSDEPAAEPETRPTDEGPRLHYHYPPAPAEPRRPGWSPPGPGAPGGPLMPPPPPDEPVQVEMYSLGDALEALDRLHPIDVVADALWTGRLYGPVEADSTESGILGLLARNSQRRWWTQGGFVLLKSRSYSADRWSEPPATSVDRWRREGDQGELGLDECAEIATLPDAQITTLQEMSVAGRFPVPPSILYATRSHLLLWGSLSAVQRRQAEAHGVPYAALSSAQKRLYVLAVTDPYTTPTTPAIPNQAAFDRSHLRLTVQERHYWGVHRDGGFGSWLLPRLDGPADADSGAGSLREARRIFAEKNAHIRPEDVQPLVLAFATFYYETDRESIATAVIQLPPRWESGRE